LTFAINAAWGPSASWGGLVVRAATGTPISTKNRAAVKEHTPQNAARWSIPANACLGGLVTKHLGQGRSGNEGLAFIPRRARFRAIDELWDVHTLLFLLASSTIGVWDFIGLHIKHSLGRSTIIADVNVTQRSSPEDARST
jgi:hypothetical protein